MIRVLPYIPEKITVHLGPPDQAANNVTLPFSDYIKNVASGEIYPTWGQSALTANILAEVLIPLLPAGIDCLKSGGIYIMSGIIDKMEDAVVTACKEHGLEVLEEICPLSARMIVNQVSMRMENDRITSLIKELRTVVDAEERNS